MDLYGAFFPPLWSNWALVGAALWAGRIALQTLAAIQEQARIARDALTKLEKPCVSIGKMEPHVKKSAGEPHEIPWLIYGFRNDGRSVAELNSVLCQVRLYSPKAPMPTSPQYDGLVDKSVFFVGPNSNTGEMRWSCQLPRRLRPDEFAGVLDGTVQLIFFGYVRYLDVFGERRISGWGWRYNPQNDGLTLVGGNSYNYDRKDDSKS